MKKPFSYLLTILLITGFAGCHNCNNKPYFDIDNMDVRVTTDRGLISLGVPISYDSLHINLGFSGKYHAMKTNNHIFSFLPTAVASEECDPNGSYGSKETFENITVIALNKFDNVYSAGDTLNDIVSISSTSLLSSSEKIPLKQFLTQNLRGISNQYILTLNHKPTEKTVQFRVYVKLTNGEKYTGETIPVTIK